MPLLAIHFLSFITILNPIIHVSLLGTLETNTDTGNGWEENQTGNCGVYPKFLTWEPSPSMLEFPKILFESQKCLGVSPLTPMAPDND